MPNVTPVSVAAGDVAAHRRPNATLRLIDLAVTRLPKGKVRAARFLGRQLPLRPRGAVKTAAGVRLVFDPSNIDSFGAFVKTHRTVDQHVCAASIRLMRPGGVYYDIGANAGYMTVEVANAHADATVVAFEPQPKLARNIVLSAAINGFDRVAVYDAIVGADDGEATLYLTTDSFHASGVGRRAGARPVTRPRVRIDSLVESASIPPPTVMKVDVEGAEMDVFAGAARTIAEHQPVLIFEAEEQNLERFGHTPDELVEYVASLADYRIKALDLNGEVVERGSTSSHDLIALPT